MPLGANMPNGTKVKDKNGKTGATLAYLKNMPPVGGYRVKWDDDSAETEVSKFQLELASGGISLADYNKAVELVTQRLGGITEAPEGQWLHQGKLVDSVLVKSTPSYLSSGEEIHAHANPGGGVRRVHVKHGQNQVRVIFDNGNITGAATAADRAWIADYKLRNGLKSSKQDYLDSKKALPT